MKKRGISPVIATILLIILTLVLIALFAAFVVPFISSNLDASCNKALNRINFDQGIYNCYATSGGKDRTGFSVKINSELIKGFRVGLLKSGQVETYDIFSGTILSNIRMISGNFNFPVELAEGGSTKTYVADGLFERVDITPILKSDKIRNVKKSISIVE